MLYRTSLHHIICKPFKYLASHIIQSPVHDDAQRSPATFKE